MKKFSINDIPEFSTKERIVAVGVIGKSPYRYPNKTNPLLPSVEVDETGIQCFWDEQSGVLYLHAITFLDTVQLAKLAANLDENSKSTDKDADAAHWLVASGELAADSCKAMALLFQLCQIVVLTSPTSVFDIGILQLFKAISVYRTELLPRISEALASINATGAWETHQRTCCPRLLFHFRKAPRQLKKNPAGLKRLEHSVEDQLYYILRKARIITNVCAESLFAIPKNEEFVYINASDEETSARDVSALIRGLVLQCGGGGGGVASEPAPAAERTNFKHFLQGHIDLAFGTGFDDNVGKYAMSNSFFELPSASSWAAAAQVLSPLYLAASGEESPAVSALYDALATDVKFSQARCAKVLPIAQASYAEGLPSHYSSQHHAHKTSVALGVVASMARGPLCGAARRRLQHACRATWLPRRLCEAPSLTHQPCSLPTHDSSTEHSSGVRYTCACNCGRLRSSRADPYSVRAANYTFYSSAEADCSHCKDLHKITFPVFQPSTPTFKAAAVRGGTEGSQEDEETWGSQGSGDPAWWAPDPLSPPSGRDASDPDNYELVPVTEDSASEKVITRQPSTTEYLPGMLHTESPEGLLPTYPHWSLVCLGSSSLYSHSMGLPEHLQPGFLPHTNYLVPWDCAVRMEQVGAWRGGRGRGGRGGAHLTVKIFIGFEYECPRGHRFMWSEGVSEGAVLARRDVCVWAACVCRADTPAHLARVHVVTPKAPLNVTLYPKVQPVAGGPIFILGPSPIPLSGSAYWILRLPFIYAWERGVLPRPRGPTKQGILHAPVFGLKQ